MDSKHGCMYGNRIHSRDLLSDDRSKEKVSLNISIHYQNKTEKARRSAGSFLLLSYCIYAVDSRRRQLTFFFPFIPKQEESGRKHRRQHQRLQRGLRHKPYQTDADQAAQNAKGDLA